MPNDVVQKIVDQLSEASPPTTRIRDVHAADIALALSKLDEDVQLLVLALLDDEKAAEVLTETDEPTLERLLERLPTSRLCALLDQMAPDDAADIIDVVPEERRAKVIAGLEEGQRHSVRTLGEYAPESAGGIMTTDVVAVGANETVRAALVKLRTAEEPDEITSLFVVDPAGTLVGAIQLVDLLNAERDAQVGAIMETDVISVPLDADQEEVARLVEHYRLRAVPVVDAARRLKGVVTIDDVLDVVDEEVTEDMLRLAGTSVAYPTSETLRARLVGRAPWLAITLLGSFGAGLMIETIERRWFGGLAVPAVETDFKALLYFIPMIGSMAGNVGTQSCTVMIRGFATGSVDPERPMRVLPAELMLALTIGVVSGLVVGPLIALFQPEHRWLGLVVGASLPCAIFAGAVTGTLIPFLCHRIRVDPAYAGGPFLSTMNDLSGYVVYFSVALGLMHALAVG